MLNPEILHYHSKQSLADKEICERLAELILKGLADAEHKVWHGHPVWFLDGNPIVGYSRQKAGIRLMFWSGVDFDEPNLTVQGGKFKDASIFYTSSNEIKASDINRWLKKSRVIQWDYKNIVKRKGKLERITITEPNKKTVRTCKNGHSFAKSSDCPVCPQCEKERPTQLNFLSNLSAPARRALESANIKTLKQVAKHSEKDLLELHGFGKSSLPIVKQALEQAGLAYRKS
jgi:hypothetical protein